jgi:hypothetical protein
MPNYLVNGDFLNGVTGWTNGPVDNPFDWISQYAWIRGDSNAADSNYKKYNIQQQVSVSDEVISAKVTAWRRYECDGGNYVNGTVKSRVKLQKPDSSWVTLADETKTAQTGSGNILDNYDVLSHFYQTGNYKIFLETEDCSACDATNHVATVQNPYGPWTNNGFTIEDPNCYIKSYTNSQVEKYAKIEKDIEILGPTHAATLTLDARGFVVTAPYPGYAHFKVTFSKVYGDSWVLYDNYLTDGSWTTILNNVDIHTYMNSAGVYTLKLETWVVSSWDGASTYFQSEAYYGSCNLNAQWYSYAYKISSGFWDDISLDILVKKYKTVIERIGSAESKSVDAKKQGSEGVKLVESYSYAKTSVKTVSEAIGLAESYVRKVYKVVAEAIGFHETYFPRATLLKTIAEAIGLSESYSKIKKKPLSVVEVCGLKETISAIKTTDDLIIYYSILPELEWDSGVAAQTAWIKTRTVMNN